MNPPIRPLDAVAVCAYLVAMLSLGWISARRSATAENYFVGRRNFPGWAVSLSMLATVVSSGTFLALPAAAFVLDWRQLTVNLVVPFVAIFAAIVFIPFFRRAGRTSAFEYLGDRFGRGARLYAAVSFMILQQVRLAQMLFLVALPMQFLTGAPLEWVIMGAGVFVALYSIVGGMETVFWAGVLQAIIMLIGAVVCLIFVVHGLGGGFGEIIAIGRAHHKFSLGSFSWNLHQRTFFTILILGLVNWLTIYSSEQTIVQRYVSARSLREARKATLMFSGTGVLMWTTFFFIGTALYAFFMRHPDPLVAQLQPDQVLPYFVFTHIPAGFAGIVIAAVLAATMSSLDSGVNSIATVFVVDLLKSYLLPGRSDHVYLRTARIASTGSILAMTLGALVFAHIKKESMNDVSLTTASVFGGCLMGLYLTGFFVRRVDGGSANFALVAVVVLNIYLALGILGVLPDGWRIPIHAYWVAAAVNALFVLLAYGISLVRRAPPRDLTGLTVWTTGETVCRAPRA